MGQHDDNGGGGGFKATSTKEIARAAVEAEFRKKKKRKRGGGYSSSDEEDGNHGGDNTSSDRQQQGKGKASWDKRKRASADDGDGIDEKKIQKAIQADLAERYRDRAAERREGNKGDDDHDDYPNVADESGDPVTRPSPSTNLIVPHNKKGLDLSLARQARQRIQQNKESTNRSASSQLVDVSDSNAIVEAAGLHVLQKFLTTSPGQSLTMQGADSIYRNRGMMDYLKLIVRYGEEAETSNQVPSTSPTTADSDNEDKTNRTSPEKRNRTMAETLAHIYDSVELDAAGRTLQQTHWVLALDGHPSDHLRAWQIPRQEVQSSSYVSLTGSNTSGGVTQLSSNIVDQVDRVFRSRNRILTEMKQRTKLSEACTDAPIITSNKPIIRHRTDSEADGEETSSSRSEEEEDNEDDIFGGVGDYIPPSAACEKK